MHIDHARIDRLFGRLSAIYGHIWQSQFKQIDFVKMVKIEWEETLRGIEDKNINLALNECRKKIEMPPTLPMFYQLCRNFQPKKRVVENPINEFIPANPATVTECMEKIRMAMNKSK